MVSEFVVGRAAGLAGRLSAYMEQYGISARGVEALSKEGGARGLAHQRISEILREPERRSSAMIQRLESVLKSPALHRTFEGSKTIRVDAPMFSAESLRGLERPSGATGFKFVYESDAYPGGYGTSALSAYSADDPESALGLVPGGEVESIVRVIWFRPNNG